MLPCDKVRVRFTDVAISKFPISGVKRSRQVLRPSSPPSSSRRSHRPSRGRPQPRTPSPDLFDVAVDLTTRDASYNYHVTYQRGLGDGLPSLACSHPQCSASCIAVLSQLECPWEPATRRGAVRRRWTRTLLLPSALVNRAARKGHACLSLEHVFSPRDAEELSRAAPSHMPTGFLQGEPLLAHLDSRGQTGSVRASLWS